MSDIWVEVSIESQPWKCTRVETQPGWTVGDIVKAAKVNLKIIDGDGFYGIRLAGGDTG